MKNYQSQHEPIFFTVPSGDTKRTRKLHKGGGGGGGDGGAAQRAAEEKARVAAGISSINNIFQSDSAKSQREQLYGTVADDAKKKALQDIEKERAITERELNFALARNGLSGGSRDVDANKDVLDTANQGILKASEIGLSTANDARSNDERTRVNLINSIQSGLDSGSAIQSAYTGMANNANAARDNASAASLAGFFDTLRANQNAAQYQQAVNSVIPQTQINKTPYTTSVSPSSKNSGNGSISPA